MVYETKLSDAATGVVQLVEVMEHGQATMIPRRSIISRLLQEGALRDNGFEIVPDPDVMQAKGGKFLMYDES